MYKSDTPENTNERCRRESRPHGQNVRVLSQAEGLK